MEDTLADEAQARTAAFKADTSLTSSVVLSSPRFERLARTLSLTPNIRTAHHPSEEGAHGCSWSTSAPMQIYLLLLF